MGFSQLGADDYHNAVQALRPDIAITMADVITTGVASVKRVEKSADRTHAWLRDASQVFRAQQNPSSLPAIFAAIPPVENIQQSLYLQDLAEEYRDLISGIALYSCKTAADLPQGLTDLPRLSLSDPASPHALLENMARGADLLTVPFIASSSDYGIALSFEFPGPTLDMDMPQPLGFDLWSPAHENSLSPLSSGCDCYTCTRHHSAYIHHLLHAKEMLAWTLLQIHNHAITDRLFKASRKSIANGTFEEDLKAFNRNHEAEMPVKTGLGPRIRGYQTKSVGGREAKKNTKAWGRLDDAAEKIAEPESGIATPGGDSKRLEDEGFAEKA